MRGIPLPELFSCPLARDGGYMRPRMAVPERQPSLHEKKPENTIGLSRQAGRSCRGPGG